MASVPSQHATMPASGWLGRERSGSQPAAAPRVHPLVRVLPSLTDLAFLLPILLLFGRMRGVYSLLGDGDTGWHIRTGEWILAHGAVPRVDLFSYTRPGQPWFAWEWLWDVIFAWFYQHGGLGAVVLISLLVICLTMALLFRLVCRRCANRLVAFAVTFLAVAGSSIHWLARPHLFTLLFVVVFYSILERIQEAEAAGARSRMRLLLLLPPLTVVWTNLHGGFFVGIILLGAYGAGELGTFLWESQPDIRRAALQRSGRYLLTALGCFLASFLNPYFYRLHTHVIAYLNDPWLYEHVNEFQSYSFHALPALFFEIMILLGAGAAFWSLRQKRFVYAFLIVGWTHLALVSARNIPILMFVAAPVVARGIGELIRALEQRSPAAWLRRVLGGIERTAADLAEIDRVGRAHVASAAVLLLVAALVYAPAPPEMFRAQYDPKAYPEQALRFLGGAGIPDRIFTHDEWGDYLVFKLYPTKVFVDGRSDFYGAEFSQKYLDVMNARYDWEQILARYGVSTILLPVEAPLASTLKESRRWQPVYDDGRAIVFRAAGQAEPAGAQVSAARASGGKGRDREITKSVDREPTVTKPTT